MPQRFKRRYTLATAASRASSVGWVAIETPFHGKYVILSATARLKQNARTDFKASLRPAANASPAKLSAVRGEKKVAASICRLWNAARSSWEN
jgi:hypothetical protein